MLNSAIEGYLALRRAAGFDLCGEELILRSFAAFATARGETHVRVATVVDWAGARDASPQRRERCLRVVRRFAVHARAEDDAHELPPQGVFSPQECSPRRRPYILSSHEVHSLLQAAARLGPSGSLRPHTYSTLLGLLVATGLRIGEALRLRVKDLTDDGLLVLRTKFRKDRLMPLHPTTTAALQRYLERRRHVGDDDPVFVTDAGTGLRYRTVRKVFPRLIRQAGIRPGTGVRSPTLHCLRHTFAVRALERTPNRLQVGTPYVLALSTYLGHTDIRATYRYLHLTGDLVAAICQACEGWVEGGGS
jgi:integrase/recombinase XerD